jgi:hypothetical protein
MQKEKYITISLIISIFLFFLAFLVYAWQEPTTNPPGGNVYVPINTGSSAQTKEGFLGATEFRVKGWDAVYKSLDTGGGVNRTFHLIGTYHGWDAEAIYIPGYNYYNPAGGDVNNSYAKRVHFGKPEQVTIDLGTGNVGIGTTNPGAKLDIPVGLTTPALRLGPGGDSGRIWTEYKNYGPAIIMYDYDDVGGGIYFRESPTTNDENNPEYEAFIVGRRGNVGIGITNPNYKLDVSGDIHATGDICTDQGGGVCLSTAGGGGVSGSGSSGRVAFWTGTSSLGSDSKLFWDNTNKRLGIGITSPADKLEVRDGNIIINNQAGGWKSELKSAGPLYLHPDYDNSGDDNVYITDSAGNAWSVFNSAGNVGIGTMNPQEKLHVAGKIRADSVIYSMSDSNYAPATELRTWGINKPDKHLYIEWGDSSDDAMYITDHWRYVSPLYIRTGPIHLKAGDKYGMFINTNGNVGIGAQASAWKLDVRSTGDFVAHFGNNAGNDLTIDVAGGQGLVNLVAGAKVSGNSYVFTGSRGASRIEMHDGSMFFYTSTVTSGSAGSTVSWNTVMSMNNAGNVGIGTTNPVQRLTVAGQIAINDNNTRIFRGANNAVRIQTNSGYIDIGPQNTTYAHIYTDRTSGFYFNEELRAPAFFYTSDQRLKTDIKPLENNLTKILNLKGVSFRWRANGEPSLGLIAQDVEKEFPEAVSTDPETGFKFLDYSRLIAPLIESIKEQQKEIEELKAEIEELKAKINK